MTGSGFLNAILYTALGLCWIIAATMH